MEPSLGNSLHLLTKSSAICSFWKQKLRLQYLLIKLIEVAKTTFQQTNKIQYISFSQETVSKTQRSVPIILALPADWNGPWAKVKWSLLLNSNGSHACKCCKRELFHVFWAKATLKQHGDGCFLAAFLFQYIRLSHQLTIPQLHLPVQRDDDSIQVVM